MNKRTYSSGMLLEGDYKFDPRVPTKFEGEDYFNKKGNRDEYGSSDLFKDKYKTRKMTFGKIRYV
jgi:hypothetical protein